MAEKRYQVFVSSTYTDLKNERQAVIQTLMEMDCIPAGMELFPAADQDQFEFIKRIIDDCDYYLLIIGGRYGSETAEGISYTEKEYDYAVEKGIKVIALIHDDIENLPSGKVDGDPEVKKRLEAFRNKAKTGRIVKFWKNSDQLAGLVALSLIKTIKMYPAIGWVRTDQRDYELLKQLNELRKKNELLQEELDAPPQYLHIDIKTLNQGDDELCVNQKKTSSIFGEREDVVNYCITWNNLFSIIGISLHNYYLNNMRINSVLIPLTEYQLKENDVFSMRFSLDKTVQDKIRTQLETMGMI